MSESTPEPAVGSPQVRAPRVLGTAIGGLVGTAGGLAMLAAGAVTLEISFFSAQGRVEPPAFVLASAGGWALAGFVSAGLVRRWPATAFILATMIAIFASQVLAYESVTPELAVFFATMFLVFAPGWAAFPFFLTCSAIWLVETRWIGARPRDRRHGSRARHDLAVAAALGLFVWAPSLALLIGR
jgi:hypothetical protein